MLKAGRILLTWCLLLWTCAGAWAITNPESRCSRVAAGAISNARYYDPVLARFIQPDDIIPVLFNPQSYNRYSYVLNNPLRYTDPSGHWGQEVANWWSGTVNTAFEYYTAGSRSTVLIGTLGTVNSLVGGVAAPQVWVAVPVRFQEIRTPLAGKLPEQRFKKVLTWRRLCRQQRGLEKRSQPWFGRVKKRRWENWRER